MTTDITELAQREKFEVWAEHACAAPWGYLKKRRTTEGYSEQIYTCMWTAWKAAGAELVEALEKAQQKIDELENDEVRQRLANAEHQLYMAELAKHNLKASRKSQFRKRRAAEKRIAELESRTVKLPDGWQFEECEIEGCENGAIFSVGTGSRNIHLCDKCAHEPQNSRLKKSPLSKRLPFKMSAGIKVEAE
ncbi:TPA: hypothetical protein UL437_005170 [Klebsiella pneumoniae]|nr:hypothetical protein [Klebsiella pneumoniae]